jgi:hypothetical protein
MSREAFRAEKALLQAVRDRFRAPSDEGGGGLKPEECNIEFDEMAPATTGDRYVVVMPAGYKPGPRHGSSGGVADLLFFVDVAVVVRAANVPRDRQREAFLDNLANVAELTDLAFGVIDWQQPVIDRANQILAEEGSTEIFIHPLVFSGIDGKPTPAAAEIFGAIPGRLAAGLKRTIRFGSARRITNKQ